MKSSEPRIVVSLVRRPPSFAVVNGWDPVREAARIVMAEIHCRARTGWGWAGCFEPHPEPESFVSFWAETPRAYELPSYQIPELGFDFVAVSESLVSWIRGQRCRRFTWFEHEPGEYARATFIVDHVSGIAFSVLQRPGFGPDGLFFTMAGSR